MSCRSSKQEVATSGSVSLKDLPRQNGGGGFIDPKSLFLR